MGALDGVAVLNVIDIVFKIGKPFQISIFDSDLKYLMTMYPPHPKQIRYSHCYCYMSVATQRHIVGLFSLFVGAKWLRII